MTEPDYTKLAAEIKPVAWMYHHPGDLENLWQRLRFERRIQPYEGMSCLEEDAGVIETPLYDHATVANLLRQLAERDADLAKLRPKWFYHGDDCSSDQCRFSVAEVIDEDFFSWGEHKAPGKHLVEISAATECPKIWAVVTVLTDEEKDARGDDEPWTVEEFATEEEARTTLTELERKP